MKPHILAGRIAADKLSEYIDASVLYETRNAALKFDAGTLAGGSANGSPIDVTTSNAASLLTMVQAYASANNVEPGEGDIAVLDPFTMAIYQQLIIGKDLNMSEAALKNGYTGPLSGRMVYLSNNLTGEAEFTLTSNPANGKTVSIAGVTFTFVSTLGSAAGNVLIGADADATRANLTAAINGAAGAGSTYVALSTTRPAPNVLSPREKLDNLRISATNNNTTGKMTVVGIGSGRLAVGDNLASGEGWTKNFVHAYMGKRASIDLVVQQDIDLTIREESKQKTDNYLTDALYGKKVFSDRAMKFTDVLIAAYIPAK